MLNRKIVKIVLNISLIIIIFLFGFFGVYVGIINDDLLDEIGRKEALIENMNLRDSLNKVSTSTTESVITKYTTGCELKIDGKIITMDELLNSLNQSEQKYYDLQNKMIDLENDSLFRYRTLLEHAQNKYGFNLSFEKSKNGLNLKSVFSKADSAALTYQYFKDRISKDSSGYWKIRTIK